MRLVMRDEQVAWKKAKDNQYDICWWVFKPEAGKWKTGEYKIKFTKKDPGIIIIAHGSEMPSTEGATVVESSGRRLQSTVADGAVPDLVKRILDTNN